MRRVSCRFAAANDALNAPRRDRFRSAPSREVFHSRRRLGRPRAELARVRELPVSPRGLLGLPCGPRAWRAPRRCRRHRTPTLNHAPRSLGPRRRRPPGRGERSVRAPQGRSDRLRLSARLCVEPYGVSRSAGRGFAPIYPPSASPDARLAIRNSGIEGRPCVCPGFRVLAPRAPE